MNIWSQRLLGLFVCGCVDKNEFDQEEICCKQCNGMHVFEGLAVLDGTRPQQRDLRLANR